MHGSGRRAENTFSIPAFAGMTTQTWQEQHHGISNRLLFRLLLAPGYLAAEMIESLDSAAGAPSTGIRSSRASCSRPLGGRQPLTQAPMKGLTPRTTSGAAPRFMVCRTTRPACSRLRGRTRRAPCCGCRSIPAHAKKFTLELYRAFFRGNRDISKLDVVGDIAAGLGYSADEVMAATQTDEIKNQLKGEVEGGYRQRRVGSPFFIVDGEPFWGADRLPMLEQWIKRGGWKY